MADLASQQQLNENAAAAPVKSVRGQLNERDMGKHNNATTGFAALAKKTGGGEKGARIAGAQLAKMRAKGQVEEGSKPDFLDLDKDGNRKEPMRSAAGSAKKGVAEGSLNELSVKALSDYGKEAGKSNDKKLNKAADHTKKATDLYSKGTASAVAKSFDHEDKANNLHKQVNKRAAGMDRAAAKLGNKFKKGVAEAAQGHTIEAHGIRGMDRRPWHKTFKNADQMMAWAEKYDAEILGTRDLEQARHGNLSPAQQGVAEGMCSACNCDPCKCDSVDESAFQAAIGKKKYGDQGMKALQKAGRDHASASTMSKIRNRYDKYDESMTDEGNAFSGAVAKAKANGIQPGEKITVGGKQYPVKEEGGGVPQTPKQKAFAKLAPPVDKITFADKIVGAKKEVDEMLGDVAAMAMKKAVRGRNRDMEEGFMDDDPFSRKSSTGGRIDTTRAGVTRHHAGKSYSGAGHDVGADDTPSGAVGRRKVGAGKGTKIGAKINTGKSKLMTREGDMDPADQGEYDQEGEMAKDSIKTVVRHAQALEKILGDNDNLPEWVQSKLAKIESMMSAVDDYMQNQQGDDMGSDDMEVDEESTNKRDNRAEKAGKRVAKDIEYDEKKKDGIHGQRRGSEDSKAERAGKKVTKDIEYDEKKNKKKKEVDETTTSGSVAASSAAPKSSGGTSYGKGIYDSMNRTVEKMISESMSVNMSMNNDSHGGPAQSLTVTATDEDAIQLAMLLRSAGLGSQGHGDDIHSMTDTDSEMHAIHAMDHDHGDEPCPACGSSDCECDEIEEAYGDTDATDNEPDWPTDEEGTDDAMMYSGGLNGPKSTGQTTVPVIAGQDDRMGYEGDHELRRMMEMAGLSEAAATPQAVDDPTNTKFKPEAPGSRIKVDPNYKPAAPKAPGKLATPQAVDDPSTKIKESLLTQLRNFKY